MSECISCTKCGTVFGHPYEAVDCCTHAPHLEQVKHSVLSAGEREILVQKLADLRYDSLSYVLLDLGTRLMNDSDKNWDEDHKKLAILLELVAKELVGCSNRLDRAWATCTPKIGVTTTGCSEASG